MHTGQHCMCSWVRATYLHKVPRRVRQQLPRQHKCGLRPPHEIVRASLYMPSATVNDASMLCEVSGRQFGIFSA